MENKKNINRVEKAKANFEKVTLENTLILKRLTYKLDRTLGKLFYDKIELCDTLEDKFIENLNENTKIKHNSCIPHGVYELKMEYSPKFKKILIELKDVPYFDEIKIHAGNDINDTSGCILVGKSNNKGKLNDSKLALNKLIESFTDFITKKKIKYIYIY